jgi:hypothetical protein
VLFQIVSPVVTVRRAQSTPPPAGRRLPLPSFDAQRTARSIPSAMSAGRPMFDGAMIIFGS